MKEWRTRLSRFIWQLRNARYQQQRVHSAEVDGRYAAELKRTEDGAGDRPKGGVLG